MCYAINTFDELCSLLAAIRHQNVVLVSPIKSKRSDNDLFCGSIILDGSLGFCQRRLIFLEESIWDIFASSIWDIIASQKK